VFVKNLNGKTMALMVSREESVEDLMAKIEERTHIPPSEQRILHAGKQLQVGKILGDYDIQKESNLHLGTCFHLIIYWISFIIFFFHHSPEIAWRIISVSFRMAPCSWPRNTYDMLCG
jgi:hypothetical protein